MRTAIVAFALGIIALQSQSHLPAAWSLLFLAGVGLVFLAWPRRTRLPGRWLMLLACALLGFAFAAGRAQWRLDDHLASEWEGRDVEVVGVIADLPQQIERGSRFRFAVEAVLTPEAVIPGAILLSRYESRRGEDEAILLRPGERWRLTVRLKRPHGQANPQGFDYEAWLLERGIRATGYVRALGERRSAMVWSPPFVVERLRGRVRDSFAELLPEERYPYAGVLLALAIGEQRAISRDLWNTFNRTGVTHLVSISGSHITMISAFVALLVAWFWRRVPVLALRCPTQRAAIAAGFLAALFYTTLAGFAVPAQRTLYMLGVVALSLCLGRRPAASVVLCLALLVVLLIDPWAVLSAGFWLSFGIVAALLMVSSAVLQARDRGWRCLCRSWGRTQWAATLASLPVLLLIFQQFSLLSPLANAIAIPVIGWVVTPLVLMAAIVPWWLLLVLAHAVLSGLMYVLHLIAQMPVWQAPAAPFWVAGVAMAGVFLLLLPRGPGGRWAGWALILPLVFWPAPKPAEGEAWVDVLDVGQGLAVLVRTRHHSLLYDAGPRLSADSDAGQRVIVPYLRAQGIDRLDTLVISHRDNDHAGGMVSVRSALPVRRFLSTFAEPGGDFCRAGQGWEWDGVRFSVLHPSDTDDAARRSSNQLSCLIRLEAGLHSLLLIADTEAREESLLLQTQASRLAADVMLVPHHGSRTSSSPGFLRAVSARHAIVSSGYRNRFGHPRPDILARYEELGARIWRTDRQGAVLVRLGENGVSLSAWRDLHHRYWHAE